MGATVWNEVSVGGCGSLQKSGGFAAAIGDTGGHFRGWGALWEVQ